MTDQLTSRVLTGREDGTTESRAAVLLGWDGVVLPELELLGCRVVPVVSCRDDVHRDRLASGDGPQHDCDLLELWEWPEAAGTVPASALSLTGILVRTRSCRRGLSIAHTWRGFGAATVLTGQVDVDEACWLEFRLPGVGLVLVPSSGCPTLAVGAPLGRQAPARRRALDRWVEEALYEHAIATGVYSES